MSAIVYLNFDGIAERAIEFLFGGSKCERGKKSEI